jgi:hypothetical protein
MASAPTDPCAAAAARIPPGEVLPVKAVLRHGEALRVPTVGLTEIWLLRTLTSDPATVSIDGQQIACYNSGDFDVLDGPCCSRLALSQFICTTSGDGELGDLAGAILSVSGGGGCPVIELTAEAIGNVPVQRQRRPLLMSIPFVHLYKFSTEIELPANTDGVHVVWTKRFEQSFDITDASIQLKSNDVAVSESAFRADTTGDSLQMHRFPMADLATRGLPLPLTLKLVKARDPAPYLHVVVWHRFTV